MAISVRLKPEDEKLFKTYAELNNISVSELVRSSVIEKLKMNMILKFIKRL